MFHPLEHYLNPSDHPLVSFHKERNQSQQCMCGMPGVSRPLANRRGDRHGRHCCARRLPGSIFCYM